MGFSTFKKTSERRSGAHNKWAFPHLKKILFNYQDAKQVIEFQVKSWFTHSFKKKKKKSFFFHNSISLGERQDKTRQDYFIVLPPDQETCAE